MVLDRETEEFQFAAIPLGGLSDLQNQILEQIASISGIPIVKLLGARLNASSEGETKAISK
jgi:uncharacterized protein